MLLRAELDVAVYSQGTALPTWLVKFAAAQYLATFSRPSIESVPLFEVNPGMPGTGYFVVSGELRATWHRDGRLSRARVTASTLIPALDSAMLRAVSPLSVPSLEREFPSAELPDSVEVAFRVMTPGSLGNEGVLFEQRVAVRRVTRELRDALGGGPSGALAARSNRLSRAGFVTLWFVVDEAGLARPETVQILYASDPQMLELLPAVVLKRRDEPTLVDGCAVPTLVRRRIDFNR